MNIPLYSKDPKYTGHPEYYDKAKGIEVTINGKKYLDFSAIGFSSCILGYADKYVNHQVKKCIDNGNMSTLNNRYMQKLNDLLLAMHPYYDDVRYCKCGGEAMDLALMLAENKTGDGITIFTVGYCGWKIKNEISNDMYYYNNFKDFTDMQNTSLDLEWDEDYRPAIIVFEMARHEYPDISVINKLKEWQKKGTILILDEITTGFRHLCGGIHTMYDLIRDIVVYSKGISNGYPISVILGKKEIIQSDLWISSTNWTDGMGFVGAYYTIKKLKHCKYYLLEKLGKATKQLWTVLSKTYGIKIKISEINKISHFEFDYDKKVNVLLLSYFIQEMLKEGIITGSQIYWSFSHTAKSWSKYADACRNVFERIADNFFNIDKLVKNRLEILNK